jgi:signal transduction histidine kinase
MPTRRRSGWRSLSHAVVAQLRGPTPGPQGGLLQARYTMDFTRSAHGHALGGAPARHAVGRRAGGGPGCTLARAAQLRRCTLAQQTRAISPQLLHQRLSLADPAEELLPWIEQFNALMERLEQAYAQLEGFNADVAHELRTPLATLIGETEVTLSRERSPEALRDTLAEQPGGDAAPVGDGQRHAVPVAGRPRRDGAARRAGQPGQPGAQVASSTKARWKTPA